MNDIMQIVHLALQYLNLGIATVIVSAVVFIIVYYIIYRKIMKGTKIITRGKLICSAILLCYMIVVFSATLFNRGDFLNSTIIRMHLFSSYREAWNDFSTTEWTNIILNILLFVPFGLLLPLWSKRFRTCWKTYLTGFLLSLIIEVIQLLSKRGVFDVDDIFNNTLGSTIGFGLLIIILFILNQKNKVFKYSARRMITMQLPLIVTIIVFSGIFVMYHQQEFGNLSESYNYRVNMSKVEYSQNTELSDQENTEDVYSSKIGNLSEALEFGSEFFAKQNISVDIEQNSVYQSMVIFRSLDDKYLLGVDYAGFTTFFTDFNETSVDGKTGCDIQTVKNALSKYGISIPETSEFSEQGNGSYTISVKMDSQEEQLTDGKLTCKLDTNGKISTFSNNIISYKKYRKCNVISEQAAYERIKEGKFLYNNSSGPVKKLTVQSVSLSYRMDSKGYFQPVYEFSALINGKHTTIVIQAKK